MNEKEMLNVLDSRGKTIREVWDVLYGQYYREVGEESLAVEVEAMIQAAYDSGRDKGLAAAASVSSGHDAEVLLTTLNRASAERDALKADVSDLTEALSEASTFLDAVRAERDDLRSNIGDLTEWLHGHVDEELRGDAHYARVLGYVERMSGA